MFLICIAATAGLPEAQDLCHRMTLLLYTGDFDRLSVEKLSVILLNGIMNYNTKSLLKLYGLGQAKNELSPRLLARGSARPQGQFL